MTIAPYTGKVTLQRVKLDRQGYDTFGSYWGIGQPLYWWCADDFGAEGHLRASSRADAMKAIRTGEALAKHTFCY